MTTKIVACALALLLAGRASAQSSNWTSTDVGAVTLAGSAVETNGVWTISGAGSDIWGAADSFQFLHQTMTIGVLTVRVMDLQNTDPFAKAGLMMRSSVQPAAAAAVLDVKPNGEVELLQRHQDGAPMQYVTGTFVTLPVWLRLEQTFNGTIAWTSQDGSNWTPLAPPNGQPIPVILGRSFEAGIAVTSHNPGQLNTAHFDHLNLDALQPGWASADVGDVGVAGSAVERNGTWTVGGAGADIWGTSDAFHFLYRTGRAAPATQQVRVRVDSLQNTSPFAKAGLMLRASRDPSAPMVLLDVKPDGGVEYMVRRTWGGEVVYLGGMPMSAPGSALWLDFWWYLADDGTTTLVNAAASRDNINWETFGPTSAIQMPSMFDIGIAVTSHDASRLSTAQFDAFFLLSGTEDNSPIGNTGLLGSAAFAFGDCCGALTVEGAGSDIWGARDSFQFVHSSPDTSGNVHALSSRIPVMDAAHPFAKAGLMFRDSLDPDAMHVIVDVKPDGGVEFMARLCTGCDTTYLGGTTLTLPVYLTILRFGTTYEAKAASNPFGTWTQLGSIDVPMLAPIPGVAVTSHDPSQIATAVFDDPPR